MGDVIIFFFFINLIFLSLIFFLLYSVLSFFNIKKNNIKYDYYECGFKSNSEFNINISINFIVICFFLLIYDIEFLFIFPLVTNFFFLDFFSYVIFVIIVIFFLFSILIDYKNEFSNWQL